MCNDTDLESDRKDYIRNQIRFIETHVGKQQIKRRNLKILLVFLITISFICSTIIPIIEILQPMTTAGMISSILAVCNTACVGLLTKFNLSKKIEKCSQNISQLYYNKHKLDKIYVFDDQNISETKRKFSKIIENMSHLTL